MSDEPQQIVVTAAVVSDNPEHLTRCMEVFTRAALGLAMDGVSVDVYTEPAERDHDDEEITE